MDSLLSGLTPTEKSVLLCTARLVTALQYWAEHPDKVDEDQFTQHLFLELVSVLRHSYSSNIH
jgi:hypothetical protein